MRSRLANIDLAEAMGAVVVTNKRGRNFQAKPAKPGKVPGRAGVALIQADAPRTIDRVQVIISGGLVRNSVLSPGARVDSYSRVAWAVILHNSHISRRAVVQNAILDKNVVVLEGATVGVDKKHDRARGFIVSSGGITVVGKEQVVTP